LAQAAKLKEAEKSGKAKENEPLDDVCFDPAL
jgi:hypothetical protein